MTSDMPCVLSINGGSSSIRFAVYDASEAPRRQLEEKIDRIGLSGTTVTATDSAGAPVVSRRLGAADHRAATGVLLDWLGTQPVFAAIRGVGHRVVQGMTYSDPERVTPKLRAELHRLARFEPDHLPREIALIEAFARRHPTLPQVACFDTAFHRTMPRVARLLPIPRRDGAVGVERYGFHGLSYAYLMEALARLDPAAAKGRVILAHLGNGASLAAVRRGKSCDTSMGFTPASGLVMSTRTGDLDPGLAYYLARTERMTAARFQQMVNHESGLLGVSGTSADVRDLLAREARDVRSAEAVALFCYQVKKWIGAFRERICDGLGFLGIHLQRSRNGKNGPIISKNAGRVTVRVIRTDEDLMIARSVIHVLALGAR
jgi:acetate kinase